MVLRFDPFREFDRLAEQMFAAAAGGAPRGMPMDLYRSGDHYVLHCDLPGVDPGSVDVSVEGATLTVRAQRSPRAEEGIEWLARERMGGSFVRQLTLGEDVDAANITATYQDGVLTVTLPVRETAKPRRIPISSSGSGTRVIEGHAQQHTNQS
jgi:HSP20 family protein